MRDIKGVAANWARADDNIAIIVAFKIVNLAQQGDAVVTKNEAVEQAPANLLRLTQSRVGRTTLSYQGSCRSAFFPAICPDGVQHYAAKSSTAENEE